VPLRFVGKFVKVVDLEDEFSGMGAGDGFGDAPSTFSASALNPSPNFGDDFAGGGFSGGITMPSRMNDMPDDAPF